MNNKVKKIQFKSKIRKQLHLIIRHVQFRVLDE